MGKIIENIEIKLKSEITDTLWEDEEGNKGTNFIEAPSAETLETILNKKHQAAICQLTDEDGTFLYTEINVDGKNVPIDLLWVSKILGQTINQIDPFTDKSLIKLNNEQFLDIPNKTVKHINDMEICTECGSPLDIEGLKVCSSCLDTKFFNVKNYSWTPEKFRFIGEQKGKHERENNIWMGVELEYGLTSKREMSELVYKKDGALYLKKDSSIEGGNYRVEMVTHPHSFDALMAKSSWINGIATLKAEERPNSNGCHVHISRTAFKSDKHFAKTKYLLLSNKEMIEAIGGRSINSFSTFKDFGNMRTASKDARSGEKYCFMNQGLEKTLEFRFMASTTNPTQMKRYIQFIHAMVLYTAYHTKTASYAGFADYVKKYKEKYEILHEFLKANQNLIKGDVTVPSYEKVTKLIENIKISDVKSITKIEVLSKETGDLLYSINPSSSSSRQGLRVEYEIGRAHV